MRYFADSFLAGSIIATFAVVTGTLVLGGIGILIIESSEGLVRLIRRWLKAKARDFFFPAASVKEVKP